MIQKPSVRPWLALVLLPILVLTGCRPDQMDETSISVDPHPDESPVPSASPTDAPPPATWAPAPTDTPTPVPDSREQPAWTLSMEFQYISNGGDARYPFMQITPHNDLIYVTNYDYLYAVHAKTGEVAWEYFEDSPWGLTSLDTANDRVYFWLNNQVHAFDGETGIEIWRADTSHESGFGLLAASEEFVYFLSGGKTLHALDAATGEAAWQFDVGSEIFDGFCGNFGKLQLDGDLLVFGSQTTFFAVDRLSGELAWQYEIDIPADCLLVEAIGVDSTRVYFSRGTGEMARLYALNRSDGSVIWKYDIETLQEPFTDSLVAYFGKVFYIPSFYNKPGGSLIALDAETGQLEWDYAIDRRDWGGFSITAYEDKIYLGTGQTLLRFDPATGAADTFYSFFNETGQSEDIGMFWLTISNARLYFGSHGGILYSLNLSLPPAADLRPEPTPTPGISANLILNLEVGKAMMAQAVFSPDNRTLALGYTFSGVDFYDTRSWELIGHIDPQSDGGIEDIDYSPDGSLLAISTSYGENETNYVELWDANTLTLVRALESREGWVSAIAFSPDGTMIVSGNETGTYYLWSVSTGYLIEVVNQTHLVSGRHAESVAFSPDGRHIALSYWTSASGGVEIWNLETDAYLDLGTFQNQMYELAYTPDGQFLAGSTENTVYVFDAATGERILELNLGGGSLSDVAIAPNGGFLAAEKDEGYELVQIFDIRSGALVCSFSGHQMDWIRTLEFSPDGSMLVTAAGGFGNEMEVLIWDPTGCIR